MRIKYKRLKKKQVPVVTLPFPVSLCCVSVWSPPPHPLFLLLVTQPAAHSPSRAWRASDPTQPASPGWVGSFGETWQPLWSH